METNLIQPSLDFNDELSITIWLFINEWNFSECRFYRYHSWLYTHAVGQELRETCDVNNSLSRSLGTCAYSRVITRATRFITPACSAEQRVRVSFLRPVSHRLSLKHVCELLKVVFEWSAKNTWWRHQMETVSALLTICAGNSPVPGEFPTQRPVTQSFDVFFDLRLNKRLSKHWWGWWLETLSRPLWRHRNG